MNGQEDGDSLLWIHHSTHTKRESFPAQWQTLTVYAGNAKPRKAKTFDGRQLHDWPVVVEVTVSPTGRSVQVHVNGERVR